jgi:hypothetical protein
MLQVCHIGRDHWPQMELGLGGLGVMHVGLRVNLQYKPAIR